MVPLADEGRAEKRPYGDAAPTEQERNAASSHSRGAAHSTRPRASIGHKASIRVTAYGVSICCREPGLPIRPDLPRHRRWRPVVASEGDLA
jgi:hypothetical protein